MTSLGSPSPFFLAGKKAYEVERSLRFNGADGPYLEHTPSSHSNKRKMTFSFWFKRAVNTNFVSIFRAYGNSSNRHSLDFVSGGQIRLWGNYNGSVAMTVQTTQVFRDFSAWYHFVLVLDTEQGTASNRVKMYVNGVQITDFATASYPSQNFDFAFNDQNAETQIGVPSDTQCNFYIAEFQEIDGLALDPSYFGETDPVTGQWNPKKYTGSYGTNGFYLNFSDNSGTTATTLGKDSSGNGNNFTPNNFSVAAGVGNDSVTDTPTNNFATLNPLALVGTGGTFANGNLDFVADANYATKTGTFSVKTGKWYWEIFIGTYGAGQGHGIVHGTNPANNTYIGYDTNGNLFGICSFGGSIGYLHGAVPDGATNGATISAGNSALSGFTTNDVLGFAVDIPNGTLAFYKNGTLEYTQSGIGSNEWFPAVSSYGTNSLLTINFGQLTATSTTYADANGHGNFKYSVPSGFLAMCSANLPDPTIKLPNKHFDTKLFTGNGSNQTISGLNFAPDWVWIKNRNSSSQRSHILTDRVRGATKSLLLPETDAETTQAQDLSAFTSDGFSVGNYERVNENSKDLVAWNWNAGDTDGKTYTVKVHDFSGNNRYIFDDFQTQAVTLDLVEGGTYIFNIDDSSNASHPFSIGTAANGTVYTSGITYFLDGVSKTYSEYTSGFSAASTRRLHITVPASAPVLYYWCSVHSGMGGQVNTNSTLGSSNFDGTLQSTVKVNATAGFSIVSYTVGNFSGMTMGHGLGVSPVIAISKKRSGTSDWSVQFVNPSDNSTDYMFLNKTDAKGDTSTYFTSTTVKDGFGTGSNGDTIIQYVFSEVAGYSKLGSYTGNGSSDGPFVFTGFRPAWIMTKRIDGGSQNWVIHDVKRDPHNVANKKLAPNSSFQENNASYIGSSSQDTIDILSIGFKMRSSNNHTNISGGTFIYLAFAEAPFKNARAR